MSSKKLDISKNIRHFRTAKNLNQNQLAELTKVSNRTVSSWEVGASQPKAEDLLLLADCLEVSVDALLGRSGARKTVETPDISELSATVVWQATRIRRLEEELAQALARLASPSSSYEVDLAAAEKALTEAQQAGRSHPRLLRKNPKAG